MTFAFLFFSGTGNTEWVAECFTEKARANGDEVVLYRIEGRDPECLSRFDCIILAHPIYGANMPRIVHDKLKRITFDNTKRFAVITTFGYVNGLGYFAESNMLNRRIDAYYNIRMFNNITTPSVKVNILPLEQRLLRRKDIEAKIDSVVKSIRIGERRIEGIAPYIVIGKLIRSASRRALSNSYKAFSVNKNRCGDCEKCIKGCPTHSIEKKDSSIVFGPNCTACMRCYNFCPRSAILINGVYADPKEFQRYIGPWTQPNYA
jgi:ferredoxin